MNLKTTIGLLVLVAAGGVWLWKGEQWMGQGATAQRGAGTLAVLETELTREKLQRIEIRLGSEPVILTRENGEWKLPGNWFTRTDEVEQLVSTLTGLRSRFEPIAIAPETDLVPFGLAAAQQPLTVQVTTGETTHTLLVGEPASKLGENPFARPNYLRLDDRAEVIRLGPDVLQVLRQPLDVYRKRQLFANTQRVKLGNATVVIPADSVAKIEVRGESESFTLQHRSAASLTKPEWTPARLAYYWELIAPVTDRVDPATLEKFLTAIPDLWAERFFTAEEQSAPNFLARTGLDRPSRIVRLIPEANKGAEVTLLIGNLAREKTRMVLRQMPSPQPGIPPISREVEERESYYYAKLANNDQVFEVKQDKFADVFAAVGQLRDPVLARFDNATVQQLTIKRPGQPAIVLVKKKGDRDASIIAKRSDHWELTAPIQDIADGTAVTDLLRQLGDLRATGKEILDPASDANSIGAALLLGAGGPQLTQLVRGLAPSEAVEVEVTDEPLPGVSNTIKLLVGKQVEGTAPPPPDPLTPMPPMAPSKKAFVQVQGTGRVNLVSTDKLGEFVRRDALTYRSKRLFDLGDAVVEGIAIQNGTDQFGFTKKAESGWQLTKPVIVDADATKIGTLASDLARIEAKGFISEAPTAEQELSYGLKTPALAVTLTFSDSRFPPRTLQFGQPDKETGNVFARFADGKAVFTVEKKLVDDLSQPSLSFRPLNVWSVPESDIARIDITRPGEVPYALARDAGAWKITNPFTAGVGQELLGTEATDLATLKAERWIAQQGGDLKSFGLDDAAKPIRVTVAVKKKEEAGAGNPAKESIVPNVLLIGKPVGENAPGRFALVEGIPGVFVLGDNLVKSIDRPALELIDRKLLAFDPRSIGRVQITGSGEPLTLVKMGVGWKVEGGSPFAVDAPTVDEVIARFANFRANTFAAYGANIDWAKYGPYRTYTLTQTPTEANAKPITLTVQVGQILAEPKPGGSVVRVGEIPGVALAPLPLGFPAGSLDFADRSLWKLDPLEIVSITRKMGGAELAIEQVGTAWELTKPSKENADQATLDELVDAVAKLRAERIAAIAPKDLKPFGLDMPAAEVTIEHTARNGKPRTLKIGGPVKDAADPGERYALADGSDLVAILPGRLAKQLLAPSTAFRDRTLANFVSADRIEVETGPRRLVFTKGAGGWKLSEPAGGDAEDVSLRELHDMLARLRSEEIVTEKASPEQLKTFGLDAPTARWRLLNGEREVLHLLIGQREKIGEPGKQRDGFRSYAKLAKSDTIVLLDPAVTAKLAGEYRKRTLFTNLDVAQAQALTFNATDATFSLRKTPLGWIDPATPTEKIDADKVSDTLDAIASLRVERFVEDNPSAAKLKEYGLNPPQAKVILTLPTGPQILDIGRFEGDSKRVYVRLPNQPFVAVLGEAETARILRGRGGFTPEPEREKIPVPPKEVK